MFTGQLDTNERALSNAQGSHNAPAATSVRRPLSTGPALEPPVQPARIMIVDDEPVNIKVVRKHLSSAGYDDFVTTTDPTVAVELMWQHEPDVVVLDMMMPRITGLDILQAMRGDVQLNHLPVLVLTAIEDKQLKLKALRLGATDFLSKPVDASELRVRIRNMLVVKAHHDHLAQYSAQLERAVDQRTRELRQTQLEVIQVLACAAEYRDQETGNHVLRVGRYAGIIAEQLGLDKQQVELIEQAAILHDVGKIGIPDAILQKPGRLDAEELAAMQQHCKYGLRILMGVPCQRYTPAGQPTPLRPMTQSPVLKMAATITMSHHEKWDGSGYPLGLKGEQIPLAGRITAVADVFDALSSRRPYKEPMSWDECCKILEEGRGRHFDPRVLDAFFARQDDVRRVQQQYADP